MSNLYGVAATRAARGLMKGSTMERQQDRLMKVEQLAEVLNVPISWVYKKAEQGGIPCIRVGRYLRFDLAKVLVSLEGSE